MKLIYLTWQGDVHQERLVIGELIETSDKRCSFRYHFGEDLKKAKKLGFKSYSAFPDLNAIYNTNVIEAFEMRLPARERDDFQGLLERWEIKNSDISSFDLLAVTGGKLPTDRFEFVDPHNEQPPIEFITELAGFTYYADDQYLKAMSVDQELRLEREMGNQYDMFAVKVYLYSKHIGYIKKVHSTVISQAIEKAFKVSVVICRIDANGIVNAIMLRVNISNNDFVPKTCPCE